MYIEHLFNPVATRLLQCGHAIELAEAGLIRQMSAGEARGGRCIKPTHTLDIGREPLREA